LTGKHNSFSRILLPFLLALSLFILPASASAGTETKPITVLVTHPKARELRNIKNLHDLGLLKASNLRLIGIYHVEEYEDYEDAQEFIAEQAPYWMELEGISCDISPTTIYKKNGCTPVFRKLFADSAGIIFTGGPDIPPKLYGEKASLTTVVEDPARHLFELSFMFHLLGGSQDPKFKPFLSLKPDYVVLGLCLGLQTMNVASGGTLIQDIPSQLYGIDKFEDGLKLPAEKVHRSYEAPLNPAPYVGWAVVHPIKFKGRSKISKTLLPQAKTVNVTSLHHQALGKLGRNIKILATSLDGKVVEMIGHKKFPGVLAVQFHPEKDLIWKKEKTYLARAGSQETNYIAAWFEKDKGAQKFLRAFWSMIGKWLTKSARAL
jgi:putative glutamine amidotransferase